MGAITDLFGYSTPNPQESAQQQATANLQTAQGTQNLNEYNQVTPYGSLTWSGSGDPTKPGGATETTTLNPQSQALLDSYLSGSQNLQTGINSLIGQVNSSTSKGLQAPTLQGASGINNVSGTAAGTSPVTLTGANGLSS